MNEIEKQVRRAHRRLVLDQAIRVLTWTVLGGLGCALVGLLVPKIWPMDVDPRRWPMAWIGGGLAAGAVAGLVWLWRFGRRTWDAAVELDHRYGLKERVSSTLALSAEQRGSAAGAALLEDAERQVRDIDVGERFRPRVGWHPILPLGTLLVAFLVAFLVPDASRDRAAASAKTKQSEQVRRSIEQLRKRLQQQKKKVDAEKLADAKALFTEFEKTLDQLETQKVDRKKALVKLNNLSKKLGDRRKALQDSERMRKQLRQLKGLKDGPAERFARALKEGDMKSALDELNRLGQKLRDGQLSEKEKETLAKQIEQLRDELKKMLGVRQKLEQKKRDLEKQIEQLKQQGDRDAAAKLQKKLDETKKQLDQLDQQNPQLKKLNKLLSQLGACRNALQSGQQGQAAEQMNQIAQQLKEMQGELEQLKSLDQLMDEIADAKSAMNCDQCNGEGCMACQGAGGEGDQFAKQPGQGMGPGHGKGDRPEEKSATGKYRTRVVATPRKGEAVRIGDANGPNVSGSSRASIQQELESAANEDPDPVVRQRLPRRERTQTKEYFEKFFQGAGKKSNPSPEKRTK